MGLQFLWRQTENDNCTGYNNPQFHIIPLGVIVRTLGSNPAGPSSIPSWCNGMDIRISPSRPWFNSLVRLLLNRGWIIIIWTGILLHTSKTIASRVKSQARRQNNWSRALKCGIVRLCSSKNTGGVIKSKKYHFFKFLHF